MHRADDDDRIGRTLWCVDGSNIRAARCAAGAGCQDLAEPADHALGRSQGGFGAKRHVLCDENGAVLAVTVTARHVHESTETAHLVTETTLAQWDELEVPALKHTATQNPAGAVLVEPQEASTSAGRPRARAGDKG